MNRLGRSCEMRGEWHEPSVNAATINRTDLLSLLGGPLACATMTIYGKKPEELQMLFVEGQENLRKPRTWEGEKRGYHDDGALSRYDAPVGSKVEFA